MLTTLPLKPAIHPLEARRIIEENFVRHFEIVLLGTADYRRVIEQMAGLGWSGGMIYDAFLLHCAQKKHCDRIYTFNVAHFQKLGPDLHDRICAP